ncbi:MAG: glycosyltransferase [Planctomycetota bacterium]
MANRLASVVIPLERSSLALVECLEAVRGQDYPKTEVIIVCGPQAEAASELVEEAEEVRLVRCPEPGGLPRLINTGMRAARGHVKVLLRANCVAAGEGWLRALVRPFEDETVGAVVAQRLPQEDAGIGTRLLDSVFERLDRSDGGEERECVSHRCDAYRASLLADIGYLAEEIPTPGDAIDLSIRMREAGYSIRLSERAAVRCDLSEEAGIGAALRRAYDYGRADAMLERSYDLRWLNAGVFAAAGLSLFGPPVAAASLPVGWLLAFSAFLWGWMLSLRLPLLRWDLPVALLNLAAYVGTMEIIRNEWAPGLFGRFTHAAIVRQWCWIGAVVISYFAVLFLSSVVGGVRACLRSGGVRHLPGLLVIGPIWRLIAGLGHVAGALSGREGKE